ncbi:hypothetical protein WMY93_003085 [Mugilogobius chulae]|uniref:Ig-like domain-containing protein n=1 Tax=Mugilogobius chulae TaxID=88201 RepID=A0AAW0PYD1_9GOBI
MLSVAVLLLLAAASCPVDSVELLQPGSVLLQPAHTLTISCRVSGYSLTDNSYATGWIRQREGKLQWIFHQWGSSSGSFRQADALKNKFRFSRDMSAGTVTIQGQSLQSEDSGVKCETLTQPDSVTVQTGHTLSITCTVSYDLGYWTAWIRQPAGKGLEWIGVKDTGSSYYKDSLKNKFSIHLDTSNKRVTLTGQNMQPGDSAVYFCARATVTQSVTRPPTLFSFMPCSSDSDSMVTLACMATGFSPSGASFSWTRNNTAVANSVQYPSVLKDDVYTGVSQIQIPRQEWDQRHLYTCNVEHAGVTKAVDFMKPIVFHQLPNLKMMTTEENNEVTFSCLANEFSPNVFDFEWLLNNVQIKQNTTKEFSTPSKSVKTANGTMFSAASFLTLKEEDLSSKDKVTCKINVGKGINEAKRMKPKNMGLNVTVALQHFLQ